MSVTPTFQIRNAAVAAVDGSGLVTGIAAGTTWILASATAAGVTKTDSMTVLVRVASSAIGVTAVNFAFNPGTADVAAGGTVTWSVDSIHHSVDFTTVGSPADIAPLQNASASRTFPKSGSYAYRCAIHPAMTGTVRVH